MQITFKCGEERTYSITVLRNDKVLVAIKTHDRVKFIPHDLAHLIVERELGLHRGFWGKVADGAMFDGMVVISGRLSPDAAKRSRLALKDEEQLGTRAEVLVAAFVQLARDPVRQWSETLAFLNDQWRPLRSAPVVWERAQVDRLCSQLRDAAAAWQKLAPGNELVLEWKTPSYNAKHYV